MTASGARWTDASGPCERPEPSSRPARAGLSNLFQLPCLFAAWLSRLGLRGRLAAALVLLALLGVSAGLLAGGEAHAQSSDEPTLDASSITDTRATLTIANHSGDWWYRKTLPAPAGTCTPAPAGESTATLTGLTADTSYTWTAYSDSVCTTDLASKTFKTLLGEVKGLSVTPLTEALSLSWTAVPGATGYKVQWRGHTFNGISGTTFGTTNQATATGTSHVITWIRGEKAVRVAATRAGEPDGPWSEEVTARATGFSMWVTPVVDGLQVNWRPVSTTSHPDLAQIKVTARPTVTTSQPKFIPLKTVARPAITDTSVTIGVDALGYGYVNYIIYVFPKNAEDHRLAYGSHTARGTPLRRTVRTGNPGHAGVMAFDVPKGHTLRTESIPALHASMKPPAYRTFETQPVEVTFDPPLDPGESATVCLPGNGDLSHYGSNGWTVLPTTHRTIDGVRYACSVVTSTSPFAVVNARVEPVPTVTLELSPARIDEDGGESTVTATLSGPSSAPTTVTVSAWATRPSLLAPLSGRVLTIAAGQTSSTGTVKIASRGDSLDETDTVVTVSGTSDAGFPVASAALTIVDDDGGPSPEPAHAPPRINEVAGVAETTDSLRVSWTPGEADGQDPAVRYAVRYRDMGLAIAGWSAPFHDGPQDVAGTQATISGLSADTVYEVQVRAESAAGVGPWAAALGRTHAPTVENTPPSVSFVDGSEQRAVAGTTFIMPTRYADAQTEARDLSFSWTQTSGPAVELESADFPSAAFRVPAGAVGETLTFRVTVTDEGGLTGAAETTVTVAAPDLRADDFAAAFVPKTLNPGAHAYSATARMSGFDLPVPVSVTASPVDASFAYYVGEDEDDAATEIAPGDELYLSVRAGETPGDTVTVTVVVGTGADAVSAAWTVTTAGASVSPATPPTAEAGAALTGKRGGDVTLAGSGTKHAEGSQDALTYSWRIKDASHAELLAGTKWLTDADKATATYLVPRRKEVTDRRALDNGQTVEFELTVTDGDGETATDTVTMTIQGSTWKVVDLSVADASAQESSGALAFKVSLSEASRDPVSVSYATSDGTARAGSDYTSASGTLTFQPGETEKTVSVTILDDAHDECSFLI